MPYNINQFKDIYGELFGEIWLINLLFEYVDSDIFIYDSYEN